MNSTGKFLVSALLVHAANLKKIGDTQPALQIPRSVVPVRGSRDSKITNGSNQTPAPANK